MATGNSLFLAQFIISYWQSFPTCVQKIKINKGIMWSKTFMFMFNT
jgi:hypothetical protein